MLSVVINGDAREDPCVDAGRDMQAGSAPDAGGRA